MAVLLETSKGDIVIDLHVDDCPNTCRNFLKLCKCVRNQHVNELGALLHSCMSPALSGSNLLCIPGCHRRMKYYNNCIFHNVQRNFIAQTGDPTGSGKGGDSVYG